MKKHAQDDEQSIRNTQDEFLLSNVIISRHVYKRQEFETSYDGNNYNRKRRIPF